MFFKRGKKPNEVSDEKNSLNFSKVWVRRIIIISVFDLQLCFILPFFRMQVPETLAVALVTQIIGVWLVYSCKAYNETKQAESNRLILENLATPRNDTSKTLPLEPSVDEGGWTNSPPEEVNKIEPPNSHIYDKIKNDMLSK